MNEDMPKTLFVATNNKHKAIEFHQILGPDWDVKTAADIGNVKWEENGATFAENSEIKARALFENLPDQYSDCLIVADDSGLCVNFLGGEPGIFSSRFAGVDADDNSNNQLLLKKLGNLTSEFRGAYFICCLTIFRKNKKLTQINGRMDGEILFSPSGQNGFGYDPIFKPHGYDISAAELSKEEKNRISHRGKALKQFKTWLKNGDEKK